MKKNIDYAIYFEDLKEQTDLADKLFERMKENIISNKLPPGFRFPNENIVCEKLGVSRSTLREAYGKLEMLNLVTRSRGGTCVNDPAEMGNLNPFDVAIKESELSELLEFRSMLESEIAALAAIRAKKRDVEKLSMLLSKMIENKHDLKKLTHFDTMFHFAVAEASKNSLLKKTMEMVRGSYEKVVYKKFFDKPGIVEHAIKYHKLILDSIAHKAPIMARETMKEHLADVAKEKFR